MKADFFSRLIERSLGRADTAQPVLPSRFEPLAAGETGDRLSQPFVKEGGTESYMGEAEESKLQPVAPILSTTLLPEVQIGTDRLSSSALKPRRNVSDEDQKRNLTESGLNVQFHASVRNASGQEAATESDFEKENAARHPKSAPDIPSPIPSASTLNQGDIAVIPQSEREAVSRPNNFRSGKLTQSGRGYETSSSKSIPVEARVMRPTLLDIPPPIPSASTLNQGDISVTPQSEREAASRPNNLRSGKLAQAEHGHETAHSNIIAVEARVMRPILAERQAEEKANGRLQQATKTKPENETPTVKVHIGRVEVRAVMSSTQPISPRKPTRPAPALSLDEYLKQHSGAQR